MGDPACWLGEVCPECGRMREDGGPCPHCRPAMLLTFGHGTASQDELTAILHDAGVELVVDVRRFPGSRRHPHVVREELERWLPAAGIDYRWEPRLGGRRQPDPDSPNTGLRNLSFRAYADHLASTEFRSALDEVLEDAGTRRTSVMCSESVWWRCHRRLIADAVVLLHDVELRHLMHDGRLSPHVATDVARVEGGRVLYDAGEPTLPL